MKLRFTIRDLFWLVLVVALAVGWWLDHRNADIAVRYAKAKQEVAEFEAKQWLAAYDKVSKTTNMPAKSTAGAISPGSLGK